MLKLIAVASPILLAATVAAATPQGTGGAQPAASRVIVVGCVVRNGAVDVDKGTRALEIPPGALALTNARITANGRGGVPGAPARDSDSGTIPRDTIVGKQSAEPATLAFELTGDHVAALGDLVGRRVEVVGRLALATAKAGAHPSAELQKLDVVSFRGVTGACAE